MKKKCGSVNSSSDVEKAEATTNGNDLKLKFKSAIAHVLFIYQFKLENRPPVKLNFNPIIGAGSDM